MSEPFPREDGVQGVISAELLERLPESRREQYKEFSIEALRVVVEDIGEKKIPTSKNGGASPQSTPIDWATATRGEKMAFAKAQGLSELEIMKREIEARKRK